MKTTRFLDIC